MDINENLLQINTFTGGMNTDTSDALINNDQYRMAHNVRLTTDTSSNTGELHIIEGNKEVNLVTNGELIIALTSIRDYGVMITTSYDGWRIWRFTEDDSAPSDRKLLFGPCTTPLIENQFDKMSLVTRYESDEIIKLYIADGKHEIMMLNIADVPENPYTAIEDLIGYTSTTLPPLTILISNASGQLYPAKVQYCYRLYSKHGVATKLAALSKPLSIYKDRNSGYANTERSGKSVDITIPDVNVYKSTTSTVLDNIQIFRITYRENGQAPSVSLVFDQEYEIDSVLTDTGNIDIQTVDISEFLSYIQLRIIPRVLESKNDYLFAGNIKYSQNKVDELFKDIDVTTSNTFNSNRVATGEYFLFYLDYGDEYTISQENSSDTVNDSHLCFRPGETYRFGVILYDTNGNASSVKHVADITIPYYTDTSYYDEVISFDYTSWRDGHKPIVNIKQPTLNIWLRRPIPGCSRYEIVRCVRTINDKRTITQGIVGRPLEPYTKKVTEETSDLKSSNKLCPSGFMTLDMISATNDNGSGYTVYANPASDIILFASPEYSYQPDDIKELLDLNLGNLQVQSVFDYGCLAYSIKYYCYFEEYDNSGIHAGTFYVFQSLEDKEDFIEYHDFDSWIYRKTQVLKNSDIYDALMYLNEREFVCPYYSPYYDSPKKTFKFERRQVSGSAEDLVLYYLPMLANYNRNFGLGDVDLNNLKKFERYDEYTGYITFNHIRPNQLINRDDLYYATHAQNILNHSVINIAYPKVPEYNTFAKGESIRFQDDVTNIGNRLYIGWSAPCILDANTGTSSVIYNKFKNGNTFEWGGTDNMNFAGSLYPIGTTGKCILMQLDNSIGTRWLTDNNMGFVITVADIRKPASPYGGSSDSAKTNSVYYSFGENFKNEASVHKLSCGDCYILLFDYASAHNWYDTTFVQAIKMGNVYTVPLYTDIDIRAQFGYKFNPNTNKSYYIQDTACAFDDYVQDKDLYMYNTAYNANPDVIGYNTYDKNKKDLNQYTTRVHYSEQKTNGESYDNWLQFKSANFLDVDSRYGDITNLKLFKDKLIFWQNNAVGVLSVNERVVLQDASATQVVLGTGSVLERYDYFSTIFGMKPNQFVATTSNEALYWWDGYKKEILQYVDKYSVTPLSTVKYVKNYLNKGTEWMNPCIAYDAKYKEIIFGCVGRNESIVYNEGILKFISLYNFMPYFSTNINGTLYTANQNNIYIQNELYNSDKSQLFGNDIYPSVTYVVNKNNMYTKTFDIQTFDADVDDTNNLRLQYNTSLKQSAILDSINNIDTYNTISDREGDYRLNIPRNGGSEYGDRLRGKTMECLLSSSSNSTNFSLKYIITKYRMSWS